MQTYVYTYFQFRYIQFLEGRLTFVYINVSEDWLLNIKDKLFYENKEGVSHFPGISRIVRQLRM